MQKLVFFVGVAGTGKTTVARRLAERIPAAFLDRDTLGGRFVEAMLVQNGLDRNDRDSDYYKANLRDLEYDTAKDVCIENLAARQNVFMISPFTAELRNREWIQEVISQAGLTAEQVDVKVIVVTLADIELQKNRIIGRQTVRDQWKLDNWGSFEKRVAFVPEINWDIPQQSILHYDNSGEMSEDQVDELLAFIQRDQPILTR
ncbi:AAA family ATPase [Paenibacillus sp. GCM10023252]|uniref:AAA family ATPase n=1 Tax=Paenibacillus sp. GCM10023252 TaxID=3252649 RepID=UPI003620A7C1